MIQCPHCHSAKRQNKAGFTRSRSQRYFCSACQRTYTPQPKATGYPATLRQDAVRHALEGISQRKTARLLHVAPQSVANWLAQAAATLQTMQQQGQMPPVPPELVAYSQGVVEQDELYTFCNAKRLHTDKLTGVKKTKSTRPARST